MQDAVLRSRIEASIFAHVLSVLYELAYEIGVDIEIHVERDFIRETTYFRVVGQADKVQQFKLMLEKSIR